MEFDDEELTWQHAQENFMDSVLDNLYEEITIQKEFRARKKNSPKVVFRPSLTPLIPTLSLDFQNKSNETTPLRRRERSISSVDEEPRNNEKDCVRLEKMLAAMGSGDTISSAKQCNKKILDKIAEEQIRGYLAQQDRELYVGAVQQAQTTSITPPSEGYLATQTLGVNFAIVLEQMKSMDPGPQFDSRNQGKISAASALARALSIITTDHFRSAILRLPLEQQWAALVVTGSLTSDFRAGHQYLHRLSMRHFENPLSALASHVQAKVH